jgi:hypothetical protein
MLGKRSLQGEIFRPENRLRKKVGEKSFYVFLSDHRHELFTDEDFAMLYTLDNGRPCVAPSLLAVALLLQTFTHSTDQETADRAKFDQRWQLALGLNDDEVPFAKSTLCIFRSQLILHDQAKLIFMKGLEHLRTHGFFKRNKITVALDTTPIFGHGAVQDTYNMLAECVYQIIRALASLASQTPEAFASVHDLTRYVGSSFKASHAIDWSDQSAKKRVLDSLVTDSRRTLLLAATILTTLPADSSEAQRISNSTELLNKILVQDIGVSETGASEMIDGVAHDRIVSVHDSEMRHGRKSASNRFNGYKASIAVETETQIIADVDILPANAHDSTDAPRLIEGAGKNLQVDVDTVLGDGAYGTAEARLDAIANGYDIVATIGRAPRTGRFTKEDFTIDIKNNRVTCPNNETTEFWHPTKTQTRRGRIFTHKTFGFSETQCSACPIRDLCVKKTTKFRSILIHEEEALLQEAKQFQKTDEFRAVYRERVVVEHRIARLVHLGIRKARYFGSKKVLFQLAMAAAVANLTRFAASTVLFAPFLFVFVLRIVRSVSKNIYRDISAILQLRVAWA